MNETPETKSVKLTKQASHEMPSGVLGIAHGADEDRLFAACIDGVYELSLSDGKHRRLYEHQSYVSSVAYLPTHKTLVSAGYDGALHWYDLASDTVTRQVDAHQFWSWKMCASPDESLIASATGQYLAGGEKYEPRPENEPSVKVYDAKDGTLLHEFEHVPPVLSVAISPDNQYVAAGNLMGEVRVWDLTRGEQVKQWTTDAFTSWGIIKSHCYIGGIFAMSFSPDSQELFLAGMGPMRDPMAGNGRQLWQRFAWREEVPRLIDQTHEGQSGEGLMETLTFHPEGEVFLMGGRLRGGKWNAALFDWQSGERVEVVKSGGRICDSCFRQNGKQLFLSGCKKQSSSRDKPKPFGVVDIFDVG